MPAAHYPRNSSAESTSAYFARVQRWRDDVGIPERAYVRLFLTSVTSKTSAPIAHRTDGASPASIKRAASSGEHSVMAASTRGQEIRKRHNDVPLPVSKDAQKPQFIDFRNPLFVELFGHLPGGLASFTASIEEVLPDEEQSLSHGGRRYCAEYVLQIDLDK